MLNETTELFAGFILLHVCQIIEILNVGYADIIFSSRGEIWSFSQCLKISQLILTLNL